MRYVAIAVSLMLSACVSAPAESVSARDVEAGPIWGQQDAELKCPVVAFAVAGRWNGQWVTTNQNTMSVCGIVGARAADALVEAASVEAGPIWDQSDAAIKCPVVAAARHADWTGEWVTTIFGKMSVCGLRPRA